MLGFRYNARNQLTSAAVNGVTVGVYTYNADGIRTAKLSTDGMTYFLLDGGYVIGEASPNAVETTYLYGANLIRRDAGTDTAYYLYNAHGDVVDLAGSTGASTKSYKYDAFGDEDDPDEDDPNPFRYCAEYFDKETGTYYLRARYYDPTTGRFTQQDTHWSLSNGIYGDVQRILLMQITVAPYSRFASQHVCRAAQVLAIMQFSNLYLFCAGNPLRYVDSDGESLMVATMLTDSGSSPIPYPTPTVVTYKSGHIKQGTTSFQYDMQLVTPNIIPEDAKVDSISKASSDEDISFGTYNAVRKTMKINGVTYDIPYPYPRKHVLYQQYENGLIYRYTITCLLLPVSPVNHDSTVGAYYDEFEGIASNTTMVSDIFFAGGGLNPWLAIQR